MPEAIVPTRPPIFLDGDTPRVHRNDPATSHIAADKSQKTVHTVRENVLFIIRGNGPLAAFEVCDLYARATESFGWSRVHHESPRKRISELRKDGVLVDTGMRRVNNEGSPEVVVALKAGA